MADVARSDSLAARLGRAVREVRWIFGALNAEQRAAGLGAVLLIVSTLGPFSFVEAAIILIAVAVLALLRARAHGREFHLPFGDGLVIAGAGVWAGLLILIRLFDRPLGQGLLALVCAAILLLAGLREKAKRPADDIATEPLPATGAPGAAAQRRASAGPGGNLPQAPAPPPPPGTPRSAAGRRGSGEQLTLPDSLAPPKPLEPPQPPSNLRAGRPVKPAGEEPGPDEPSPERRPNG